jgi:pimeloyl-ACP methyl ester carboxylesterase
MVIWSWPSDRIRGTNRKDVRLKAAYSDVQGGYLAEFLGRLGPEAPVSLVGYSFGARIITMALDRLDGDRNAERAVVEPAAQDATSMEPPRAPAEPPRRRAVLIAAALDAGWLAPGGRHGRALRQVERMLITRNCCDPVLRLYPLMYRVGGPQALGYVGPICLGKNREKTETAELSCAVGRAHAWSRYIAAPGLWRPLAEYSFLDSAAGKLGAASPEPSNGPEG